MTSNPTAIRCPGCGAPAVPAADPGARILCPYCGTSFFPAGVQAAPEPRDEKLDARAQRYAQRAKIEEQKVERRKAELEARLRIREAGLREKGQS